MSASGTSRLQYTLEGNDHPAKFLPVITSVSGSAFEAYRNSQCAVEARGMEHSR